MDSDATDEPRAPLDPAAAVRPPRALAAALYLVATPIGAARDITLRALDILGDADVLAAEDTRTLRHLMEIHGVALRGRSIIAAHDHNGPEARARVLAALKAGQSVAYASEAGTPVISDPGFDLARAAREAGHAVLAAPGASAVLTALCVAGLPAERFFFAGFLPSAQTARAKTLQEMAPVPATLVFYESPRRLAASLADMARVLGPDRPAAVCRELTKRFEEVTRGSLRELADSFATRTVKGEIVVLAGAGVAKVADEGDVKKELTKLMQDLSLKDAVAAVAEATGMPRRQVYGLALELGKQE